MKHQKGFTLIELLVVIGIIAILASVTIVALNPARQFAQSRNTQRSVNVNAILNGIGQNMADNDGSWACAAGVLPTTATNMDSTTGYDIGPCLVDLYLAQLPVDPTVGTWVSTSSYDTGYTVLQDPVDGRVTVAAPSAELSANISVSR